MGCQACSTSNRTKKQLFVATLNYCSIMSSPFEFYCKDLKNELYSISYIFASLIPKYIPDFNECSFQWKMGKIDLKVRTGRYCPFYSPFVGIEQDNFIRRDRFSQIWDARFNEEARKAQIQFTLQERQMTKLYDFIAYHSLLSYVYKYSDFQQLVKENTALYKQKMKPFFQLSFLDERKKLGKMIQNFKYMSIDVLFVQEFARVLEEYVDSTQQFIKVTDCTKDTMIIARRSSFTTLQDIDSLLSKSQIESLNWAERTSLLCLDNIILINAHLSSKKQKNKAQIQSLKQAIVRLKIELPQYHIILGGDLNSFLDPNYQYQTLFSMFPFQQGQLTTVKRRTMAQAQYHKGNKLVSQSKDKIITSLRLKDCRILYISNTQPNKQEVVPSDDHPFDHFLVVATVYQ